MAVTVLEQIGVNVLTTLQGVTTANGYDYQLNVSRAVYKANPKHLDAIIYQITPDDVRDAPTMTEEWRQLYSVVVYIRPEDDDTTPVDSYNNACIGAVHKELQKDYTRGGLAIDTQPQPYIIFPPVEGEFGGFTYNFVVTYRTRLDDPFTLAT
jgi:hypothetical protein